MSGPNLHVFTLKFLALKTTRFFPHKKNTFHNFFDFCLPLFNANFQFKKKFELFFVHKNFKKRASKLLKIGPDPFISQSRPDHSPQPRIDFSHYEISGPDICCLICALQYKHFWCFVFSSDWFVIWRDLFQVDDWFKGP